MLNVLPKIHKSIMAPLTIALLCQATNGFEALRGAYRNYLSSDEERMVSKIKFELIIYLIANNQYRLQFIGNSMKGCITMPVKPLQLNKLSVFTSSAIFNLKNCR